MNETEYAKAPGIRWTHLREMSVSAAHYQAAVLAGGLDDTRDLRLGRAIHCAALEPLLYPDLWVTYTGDRRGKKWTEFSARHSDKEILTDTESALINATVAALRRNPLAMTYLEGAIEQMITWVDDATGLRCKARPDVVHGRATMVDLKSSRDVTPRLFGLAAARLGYHGQAAYYYDGLVACGYRMASSAIVVAVEKTAPWDVVCFELSESVLQAGRSLYQRLLFQVLDCEAKYGAADRILVAGPDGLPALPVSWPGRAPGKLVPLELPQRAYDEAAGPLDFGGVEVGW